jgi:hypothetical protein
MLAGGREFSGAPRCASDRYADGRGTRPVRSEDSLATELP